MSRDPRTERIKRERFMPFQFDRFGLRLELEGALLDGQALPPFDSEEVERGELHLEDDRWQTLHLDLVVELDPASVDGLLPEQERASPPLRPVIVIEDTHTRVRRAVDFPAPEAGRARVRATIARHEVAGPVSMTPWLVRSSTGPFVPGYANEEGHHLASGRSLTIYPYAPHVRPGQFLDVQYKSFAEDVQLRAEQYRLYYLSIDTNLPTLFVNADHPEVIEVLDAKGQTGIHARLREVFYDVMSFGVWTQLFMCAVEALSDEGEARHPWQTGVLAELLPQMFPHVKNHQARVTELLEIRQSDHALSQLSELCDRALQERLDLAKHMERLVQDSIGEGAS